MNDLTVKTLLEQVGFPSTQSDLDESLKWALVELALRRQSEGLFSVDQVEALVEREREHCARLAETSFRWLPDRWEGLLKKELIATKTGERIAREIRKRHNQ